MRNSWKLIAAASLIALAAQSCLRSKITGYQKDEANKDTGDVSIGGAGVVVQAGGGTFALLWIASAEWRARRRKQAVQVVTDAIEEVGCADCKAQVRAKADKYIDRQCASRYPKKGGTNEGKGTGKC